MSIECYRDAFFPPYKGYPSNRQVLVANTTSNQCGEYQFTVSISTDKNMLKLAYVSMT